MAFFVQLNDKRAAWQRIEWPTGFDENWDEDKVREAIDNFICVAECEEERRDITQESIRGGAGGRLRHAE